MTWKLLLSLFANVGRTCICSLTCECPPTRSWSQEMVDTLPIEKRNKKVLLQFHSAVNAEISFE